MVIAVIARNPFSEQNCQETKYSTWEKRAMFSFTNTKQLFGVGGEEKNNILIHAL